MPHDQHMDSITNAVTSYLTSAIEFDAAELIASFGDVAHEVVQGEVTDGSLECDWSEV